MKYHTSPAFSSCLLALLALLCCLAPARALVITEIMYHPVEVGGIPSGDEALEFIELYNDRAVVEDLSGYAFVNGVDYTFPEGTTLAAKSYLVVARDPAAVEAAYGIENVYGPFEGRLNNDGERIELAGAGGEILISFRYNEGWPWPAAPDGTGHTLVLATLAGDPEQASAWAASTLMGGTPGGPDQVQVDPVDPTLVTLVDIGHAGRYFKGVQEPSPGPGGVPTTDWTEPGFDDDPATTDWIDGPSGYGYSNDPAELQYIRTQLNDMVGGYMSIYARLPFTLTQDQIDSFAELHAQIHHDDAFVLYLNGVRVAASPQLTDEPPAYNASGAPASDPAPVTVDLTGRLGLLQPGENILAIQGHNATLSGSSDCLASPILQAVMVEESGADDLRARIVVNELLTNSDSGPDWIELYNPGPIPVDLSNVYISDGRFDLLQYRIPDGVTLQPGQYWAVAEGTAPGELPFGLATAGETVFITVATDDPEPTPIRVLDAVRFGGIETGVTQGRFPDGADTFVALSSPTFQTSNAQPLIRDIVINEIMYHHGSRDKRYEYIELYNRGTTTVPLTGWALTDGVDYEFPTGLELPPDSYLVVAEDPNFLAAVYPNLAVGENLVGPWSGGLDDHSERIRLSYPREELNPNTGQMQPFWVTVDEVTYFDGGRWPHWADGQGTSLELRDPHSNNSTPDAWADSDESAKSQWKQYSFTIDAGDAQYTHDTVNIFDLILLNRGEILLDDLEVIINGANRLANSGFESGTANWRLLGNHVRSFVTTEDRHSGSRALRLVATGHGDPGANRINQSISGISAGSVTFRFWAKWQRGSRFLLLRTARELAPTQPPRPSHSFELDMPVNLGTPGQRNTAFTANRGPSITEVRHSPTLPVADEPIVVTARVTDEDGLQNVTLFYRSEGQAGFTSTAMVDDGSGDDAVANDGLYTATIPGASAGTMRAFYIQGADAQDGASTRFPTVLQPSAPVPNRTCLVRVGDARMTTQLATYRLWLSNDVINEFTSRPNLANELVDCTFVYNDTEVFYNVGIRFRGSPFLRSGFGRDPRGRWAFRIDFNSDQRFRDRDEINLDNTEDAGRGPLQERASYWFYRQMGLQNSRQEYIRPIINGNSYTNYEDVRKIDGDYIDGWFPDDNDGYIHKIDDYFEYSADGTSHSNLDEGLKQDAAHPLLKETYRWGFEVRSHREDDNWDHLFAFAAAMNTPSSSPDYEQLVESMIDPAHFARVLAIRHAVGDWDSYGYTRGKNNYFYYALPEGRWYLLPWDIDFTLGSGHGPTTNLFTVEAGDFPEVQQFLNYPKYRRLYLQAFAELVAGPWDTSYGTAESPTDFDRFLDDAADALAAEGFDAGRRNGIKDFVRTRRDYILSQIPSLVFAVSTPDPYCTSAETATIEGVAPLTVAAIAVNGVSVPAEFSGNNAWIIHAPVDLGTTILNIEGLDGAGNPVPDATGSITVTRVAPCSVASVAPALLCNDGPADLTLHGSGFTPGSATAVTLTRPSEEVGFDALYVQNSQYFDAIQAATLLLNNPDDGVTDPTYTVHESINLTNNGSPAGVFLTGEQTFAAPFNSPNSEAYALRLSGYIYAPSAGPRYFGVNSDDGFALWIDDQLVGEYAAPRGPTTSDVNGNLTAGDMTFDFPAEGVYRVVLDFYENGGGEALEFFQTDAAGGNARLINVDAELVVYRDSMEILPATDIAVVDENTITCRVDLLGAQAQWYDVIVTPECGQAAKCILPDAVRVVAPAGAVDWSVLPAVPVGSLTRQGAAAIPTQHTFVLANTGTANLPWAVYKQARADWIDLPAVTAGDLAPGEDVEITLTINAGAAGLSQGLHSAPIGFTVGCNPTGPATLQREVQLLVSSSADLNVDLHVDLLDWPLLAAWWQGLCDPPTGCDGADLDASGAVDINDLAIFAEDWLLTIEP